ncbi:serine hydrolase domain-containing protein [Actinocatenispora sera]|uniref:Beta-lactamase-related domain-containing protein n=1 Tax=Actinocatenispora sera TaxID=390989 RepID=A0A810KUQ1_9ACTN|nr:serine hydrolase domain-containing protein [Actinocatenispora sera]BCJ26395.1 hypothetical protein Asera_05030 [Actinocatenispora sera]
MGDLPEFLDRYQLERPRSDRPLGFAAALADHHVPGISIALLEHGQVTQTWTMGRRSVTSDAPVEPDTLFQAASISKSIAAACVLRLVDESVLDLDTDVNDLLKSWQLPANDGWQPHVTLRQLLAHTAGTTVHGLAGYPPGMPVPSVPDILDGRGNSAPVRVTAVPGVRHSYSGGGYTIAQLVLTDVTGLDVDTLAWELVFEPAGMVHSTFAQPLDRARAVRAASAHRAGPAPVAGGWHTYADLAAAGMWSTATDVARFFAAIRDSAAGAPGALLSARSTRAMLTRGAPNRAYGLGVGIAEPGAPAFVGHSGSNEGYRSWAGIHLDDGSGAAIMTNGDHGYQLITDVLLPALRREYGWPAAAGAPTPAVAASDLAGRYVSRDDEFVVAETDAGLTLTVPGQPPVPLTAGTDGGWRARVLNVDVRFPIRDGDRVLVLHQELVPDADVEATRVTG